MIHFTWVAYTSSTAQPISLVLYKPLKFSIFDRVVRQFVQYQWFMYVPYSI